MAKFKFIEWLVSFLESQDSFLFDWNDGNSSKSKDKHGVEIDEIESSFSDPQIIALGEQCQPETTEARYGVIAKAAATNRILFVCFTIRSGHIRPISARVTNKKERDLYEE